MKKIILSLLCSICFFSVSYSQCEAYITATSGGVTAVDTLEICLGETVTLSANGSTCSQLMNNSFNDGSLGLGWYNTAANPVFNNPCQCPFAGGQPPPTCSNGVPGQIGPDSAFAWVGAQTSTSRSLTTQIYDLTVFIASGGCRVSWWMMYGITSGQGDCEDPDWNDEGVHLQYSTNGTTWTDFSGPHNDPVGNLSPTPPFNTAVPGTGGYWTPESSPATQLQSTLYFWNQFESYVPSVAYTSTTRFRFAQENNSNAGWDAWGIDEVGIVCNAANTTVLSWSNGSGQMNQQVTPTADTMYYFTITDTTTTPYVTATDSVYVIVHPIPTSDFTVVSPICSEDTSIIEYTGNPTSNPTFHWTIGGDTTQTIGSGAGSISVMWEKPISPASSTNTINLVVESQFHCFSDPSSHDVIVNATPDISYTQSPSSPPVEGCAPLSVSFIDGTTPALSSRIWDFGDGNTSGDSSITYAYQTPGVYTPKISVVTIGGCEGEYTSIFPITILPQPIADFTWDPPIGTRQNPVINFTNLTTPNDPSFTWQWDFGDNGTDFVRNPTHIFPNDKPEEKKYAVTLIATSDQGCNDTITYSDMKIIDDLLLIPNILTPNGDGINDKLIIGALEKGGGYTQTQLIIYNRWGKKVYENSNYMNDFGGEDLPDGSYFIMVKGKGVLKDIEYKSSLQILR